jgi:1,4-dihydroxy-2-naphthoate octaprenyltransferase
VHLFGLFDQLFVVYANDVADYPSDLHNTTHGRYSGGSRRRPPWRFSPWPRCAFTSSFATTAPSWW